tara:strand:+ start:107 stop:436 length:330 start_codon:yes stop_codon:yes gene_type:complete
MKLKVRSRSAHCLEGGKRLLKIRGIVWNPDQDGEGSKAGFRLPPETEGPLFAGNFKRAPLVQTPEVVHPEDIYEGLAGRFFEEGGDVCSRQLLSISDFRFVESDLPLAR